MGSSNENRENERDYLKVTLLALIVGVSLSLIYYLVLDIFYNVEVSLSAGSTIRFSDFTLFLNIPNIPSDAWWALPPPSILGAYLWKGLASLTSINFAFIVYLTGWFSLLVYSIYKVIGLKYGYNKRILIASICLVIFSYPTFFTFDRGNASGYVASFSLLALYYYNTKEFNKSIIFIAFAACLKLTPVVFFALFLFEKRWKFLFKGISLVFLIMIFSTLIVKYFFFEEYGFSVFQNGLENYYKGYVIGDGGWLFGVSFFGLLKSIIHLGGIPDVKDYFNTVSNIVPFYNLGIVTVTILTSVLLIVKESTFLQRITLLVCWLLLAPHVMAEYYLTLLYIPLAFSLFYIDQQGAKHYLVIICLIILPKSFYIPGVLQTSVYISPILLLILTSLCVYNLIKMPKKLTNMGQQ